MCRLTYTKTNKAVRNNTQTPSWCFFDGKLSAKAKRNCLTETPPTFWCQPVWLRYWSVLWRQRENNNQGLPLEWQRDRSEWCLHWLKTNRFYCQCHLWWSYQPGGTRGLWFEVIHTCFHIFKKNKVCFPSASLLRCGRDIATDEGFVSVYHSIRCRLTVNLVAQKELSFGQVHT